MQVLCRTLPERFILSVCLLLPPPVSGGEDCMRVVFCCFLPIFSISHCVPCDLVATKELAQAPSDL